MANFVHQEPREYSSNHLIVGYGPVSAVMNVYRPRGSGDWLIMYTQSGFGRYILSDGRTWTSTPGTVSCYEKAAHQRYGVFDDGRPWVRSYAHFAGRPEWRTRLSWSEIDSGLSAVEIPEGEPRAAIEDAWTIAYAESLRRSQDAALAFNALERVVLLSAQWARRNDTTGVDRRIRRVSDYLDQHWREPFNMVDLAARSNLSVSRFSHLFVRQIGQTPFAYCEMRRMEYACRLLRATPLPISAVADEVGFSDALYFSNRFRRFYGVSPTAYRHSPAPNSDSAQ